MGLWAWPSALIPPKDQVRVLQEMQGLWSFRGREVVIRGGLTTETGLRAKGKAELERQAGKELSSLSYQRKKWSE